MGGRRPAPDHSGVYGFITWDRVSHGSTPRLELAPDNALRYWYDWPDPDLPKDVIS